MAAKRPIVVGGSTPGKPESKRPSTEGTSRKTLFQEGNVSIKPPGRREWSDKETSALVQYICLFWEDAASDKWPMQRDPEFWDGCASAINRACCSSRTGLSNSINIPRYCAFSNNELLNYLCPPLTALSKECFSFCHQTM